MPVNTPIDYAQASLLKLKLRDDNNLEIILHLGQQNPWLFELKQDVLQKKHSENQAYKS